MRSGFDAEEINTRLMKRGNFALDRILRTYEGQRVGQEWRKRTAFREQHQLTNKRTQAKGLDLHSDHPELNALRQTYRIHLSTGTVNGCLVQVEKITGENIALRRPSQIGRAHV